MSTRRILSFSDQPRRRSLLVDTAGVAAGSGVAYAGYRAGKAAKAAEKIIAGDGAVAARNAREITDAAVQVKRAPRRLLGKLLRFSAHEFAEPLNGKLARDRFVKRIHDEDLDRRDANLGRAAVAGAGAGALLKGKAPIGKRAILGALLASGGVLAVRQATRASQDIYGERSRGAKKVEIAPAAAAIGVGAYGLKKRLRLSRVGAVILFREKPKRELPSAVKAGISAALSGATLGLIPAFRRGTGLKTVLKSVATGAGAGAAVGGGGTAVGSKILGPERLNEGAPITKRAAVGGAAVGAGLGILGGILAHKTGSGRRLLVGASKAWRPARWARKSGVAGAAAIGGTAGLVAGGAHAADEGQQVDTINSLKRDRKKTGRLLARCGEILEFGKADQPRYADSKRYAEPLRAYGDAAHLVDAGGSSTRLTQSQLVGAAWRTGHTIRRTAQRGGNLARDVGDVVAGRPAKGRKREWDKSWFRNAVLSGGGAGAVLTHAVLRRKVPGYRRRSDAVEKVVRGQVTKVRKKIDGALDLEAGAVKKIITFDYYESPGWDLRDGRGKSARVFAPGAQKRLRRPAAYHETKEGQRRILTGVAVAGTVGGLVAGAAISPKLRRVRRLIQRQRPWVDAKAIDPKKIISMPQAG